MYLFIRLFFLFVLVCARNFFENDKEKLRGGVIFKEKKTVGFKPLRKPQQQTNKQTKHNKVKTLKS